MDLVLDHTHGLTLLTRLAQHRPGETHLLMRALAKRLDMLIPTALAVAVETGDPIGIVVADLVRAAPDGARAERVNGLLPKQTVALRELGAVVAGQLVDARRRAADAAQADDVDQKVLIRDFAAALHDLSIRLGELGSREAALVESYAAVTHYRLLYLTPPDANTRDSATSMRGHSESLDVG